MPVRRRIDRSADGSRGIPEPRTASARLVATRAWRAVGQVSAPRAGPRRRGSTFACSTVALILSAFILPACGGSSRVEAPPTSTATEPGGGDVRPAVVAKRGPPQAGELAVAEQAGPWIAAAWVRTADGATTATVRLLDYNSRPVAASIAVSGATVASCGSGCVTLRARPRARSLRVTARLDGSDHRAVIPIRWDPPGSMNARRILARALGAINRLRSQRIVERLSGGAGGPPAVSRYRIAGRYDYSIVARNGGPSATIVIGRDPWVRQSDGSWQKHSGAPADTRELMPWWTHRTAVRLLDVRRAHGRRIADIAIADIPAATDQGAALWFRLRIDVASSRVLRMRMIAPAHFMTQRYSAFNAPTRIRPPAGRSVGGQSTNRSAPTRSRQRSRSGSPDMPAMDDQRRPATRSR